MKNYKLSDFNKGYLSQNCIKSVKKSLNQLKKRNKIGLIFGEFGEPTSFDIRLKNASHSITNITLKDNKIFGDVKFLDNKKGRMAKDAIDKHGAIFAMRSLGYKSESGIDSISKIFTWDIVIQK